MWIRPKVVTPLSQLPQKMTLNLKVAKVDSKIIISLLYSDSVTLCINDVKNILRYFDYDFDACESSHVTTNSLTTMIVLPKALESNIRKYSIQMTHINSLSSFVLLKISYRPFKHFTLCDVIYGWPLFNQVLYDELPEDDVHGREHDADGGSDDSFTVRQKLWTSRYIQIFTGNITTYNIKHFLIQIISDTLGLGMGVWQRVTVTFLLF